MLVEGVVEAFSDSRGDGFVIANSGARYYFHCVTIADGTRTIEVGAKCTARRIVGHLGVDEVADVAAL